MRNPYEKSTVKKPKNILDVPRFLFDIFSGFFKRFWYIVRLVWRTGKWILFLLTFVAIFNGVMPVIGSLISKNIINELQKVIQIGHLPKEEFFTSTVFYLLIYFFVFRIGRRTVTNIANALNRIAGEKVVMTVKMQIMEKAKELDLASFDMPDFYERMENANREAGNRPLQILSQTFGIVSSVIEFASYIAILFAAPGLKLATIAILVVAIPSAVITFVYRRKNYRYMRYRSKDRRMMNYYSNQLVSIEKVKEVKMYDLADTFIERFFDVFKRYYKGLRKLIVTEHAWHILFGILTGLTNLYFYALIALRVFTGEILIGDYTLYTGAILSVSTCISNLITTSSHVYEGTLFIDNLIAFMDEPVTVKPLTDTPIPPRKGSGHTIEFRNVSFAYPKTERFVIKNINLVIEEGETVVLVGLNGSGKTTLIKLLTRLYDPTEGQIFLDGRDIREYDLKSLYSIYGIIFQDFGHYAETVEENIRFGDIYKEFSEEEIKKAAVQSSADEYITSLPESYKTPLMRIFDPTGTELSGGQWQKIAIARAFYADSDILILDEPTAALDPIAEQEIFRTFDNLREDKTTIFVSHRLSSATVADKIVVLENGEMIECGNHETLMKAGGRYHELFTIQAEKYLNEVQDSEQRSQHQRNPRKGKPYNENHNSD